MNREVSRDNGDVDAKRRRMRDHFSEVTQKVNNLRRQQYSQVLNSDPLGRFLWGMAAHRLQQRISSSTIAA